MSKLTDKEFDEIKTHTAEIENEVSNLYHLDDLERLIYEVERLKAENEEYRESIEKIEKNLDRSQGNRRFLLANINSYEKALELAVSQFLGIIKKLTKSEKIKCDWIENATVESQVAYFITQVMKEEEKNNGFCR